MNQKSIVNRVMIALIGLMMFAGFLLPSTSVAAEVENQAGDTGLENMLMREKISINNQRTRLDNSAEISVKTQEWIDKLNAKGKDTTELTKALAAFNAARASAENDHATAAGILANPAGFDADGKVTERKAALETVRSAGQALRQAHLTITQATINLRLAIQSYVETL